MKNITLIILSILLFSCNKDIVLEGTIWINQDGSEQFEFYDTTCKYTLKLNNSGSGKSVFYTYGYEEHKITLVVPSMTGFYNYTGDVSTKKMILYPLLQDSSGNDSIVHDERFKKVFHIK